LLHLQKINHPLLNERTSLELTFLVRNSQDQDYKKQRRYIVPIFKGNSGFRAQRMKDRIVAQIWFPQKMSVPAELMGHRFGNVGGQETKNRSSVALSCIPCSIQSGKAIN